MAQVLGGDLATLVARLVGMAERIESVRFSPDGNEAGRQRRTPGPLGRSADLGRCREEADLCRCPITNDSIFGVSWSPDGKRVAFGCTDKSVRAIDAETGAQTLF